MYYFFLLDKLNESYFILPRLQKKISGLTFDDELKIGDVRYKHLT